MTNETREPEAMPTNSDHSDTILQVMADHNVSGADLVRRTGLSSSTISRVISGQYAVTPPITQALWQMTGDPRILQVALGTADAVVLDADRAAPDRAFSAVDQATCIIACNQAIDSVASISTQPHKLGDDQTPRVRVIDAALRQLLLMRTRLTRNDEIPFQHVPAQRRLPDSLTA